MSQSDAAKTPMSEIEQVRGVKDTTLPFDLDLQHLVDWVNLSETMEVGITLHVGGAIVSGLLISNTQFFRLLIQDINNAGALPTQTKESFANFYRFPLEAAEAALQKFRDEEEMPPQARHLHLRHAQTFVVSYDPIIGRLWRGRLTSVDGWSIGNLGSIPPLSND